MTNIRCILLFLCTCVLLIFLSVRCEKHPPNPNLPPNTSLANIPPPNDSTNPYFPLLALSWDGEDKDGFIIGFYYRYTTFHIFKGDSFVQEWQFTEAHQDTINFDSSDTLNLQKFEVKAVDNDGDEDPTPAVRFFYTKMVEAPETEIVVPMPNDTFFALERTTDWWEGIKLRFSGSDPDGEVMDYAWKVDTKEWSAWTSNTSIMLTPDDFDSPIEGKHTIMVKARDNTWIEDPTPATVAIYLIIPSFNRGILVLDDTRDGRGGPENPTDAAVDSFYQSILAGYDFISWDYADSSLPPKALLGQYRILIWHEDATTEHHLPDSSNIEYVKDYLNVGGKLCLSGWRTLFHFREQMPFPMAYYPGDFIHDYLHVAEANENSDPMGDFIGAHGINGFPDVEVDLTKLYSFRTGIYNSYVVNMESAAPFTDPILLFRSASSNPDYEGYPCAVYHPATPTGHDVVFLGFPLYYLKQADADTLIKEILN
ncbi:MAG TPA: hypothetical protein EYP60_08780, partial [bacterium (Candidatus Stahlbacteria)]|nr:hypothetical protein [Candidatus Stahlbacteria bacterium]